MAGYEKWSHQQLIAKIKELEKRLGDNAQGIPKSDVEPTSSLSTNEQEALPTESKKPFAVRRATRPPPKAFDASKYDTRLIALKFAYLGQKYNGFEHHKNNTTPLPTIEEELWKALVKTRLITPIPTAGGEKESYERIDRKTFARWDREGADVNWDGCEYSKCGRTDRGVSAFGQVIGVRVRSNKPLPKALQSPNETLETNEDENPPSSPASDSNPPPKPFNDLTDELPYIQLLNRVLPPDIRVYAWCPNPPADFSARFSCKERRYKYFFTNPCFAPVPGSSGRYNTSSTSPQAMREGWLDINAMKQGCAHLVGLHDFRNFCKIDASKQLTNFQRRIFHADIEEVSPLSVPAFLSHPALSTPGLPASEAPKLYSFTLHGSAFLWHQVRSLIAVLFLIGQGLESPDIIPKLLDIEANPTRPKYEMASDAPLVLWDCIFPHADEVQSSEERQHGYQDRLKWVYIGDEGGMDPKAKGLSKSGTGPSSMGRGKWGRGGVVDDVWEMWRGNKVDETLAALLLDKIAGLGSSTLDQEMAVEEQTVGIAKGGPRVFDGGDLGRAKGNYTSLLERERQESVDVVNERYRMRKGIATGVLKGREEDGDE
ncbi:hypothetical protein PTNB73_03507 [Pyrenophora teres f. teres]|uniref:Pseudouridine synthase I TruA alpha/beta domain-containing protein n=2 Tax=Pyrenophora teres f. teres TaxID=97479 RepID=E3RFX3_PYRTT|nr:hypothetical protein PTT_06654 [Pyrenophora teres f. teres 0-1]KAE8838477.1 hypothetical protein HRS9139_02860 [Pyrenophora teres f. teres]KAE8844442.1 hypothetical protein PTNB85_02707 [Pyrenophora teres f. teres]KAE8847361.1 hypothetical protein HRS9122_04268 [Pyrenophora teres f. teres]KAE8866411.1 hypothetical protein PTNB29_03558 [Pyrenophora teres f. teres]